MVKKKQTKKEEIEAIELSEEDIQGIQKLKGSIIKDFFRVKENEGEELILAIFVKRALESIDIFVDDPYEELDLATFMLVLEKVMEDNNLEQLFRAFERLS